MTKKKNNKKTPEPLISISVMDVLTKLTHSDRKALIEYLEQLNEQQIREDELLAQQLDVQILKENMVPIIQTTIEKNLQEWTKRTSS